MNEQGRSMSCLDAADMNDDSKVDVSDPIASLNFLFLGTFSPISPGPNH